MGRFWLGVSILAVFLGLGLWTGQSMNELHTQLSETLELAAEELRTGETEKGFARAQQAQETWQQQWHGVAALADHAPMDEIDGLFAQMETYGKAGAAVDAAACCARLSKLVAAVGEAHSLNWWNLL